MPEADVCCLVRAAKLVKIVVVRVLLETNNRTAPNDRDSEI